MLFRSASSSSGVPGAKGSSKGTKGKTGKKGPKGKTPEERVDHVAMELPHGVGADTSDDPEAPEGAFMITGIWAEVMGKSTDYERIREFGRAIQGWHERGADVAALQ